MKKSLMISMVSISLIAGAYAMDLNDSINVAIKNNPTVIASQKKAAAAKAKLNQAVSTFFPTLGINGNLDGVYSQPATAQIAIGGVPQTIKFGVDQPATVAGVQATLSQQLFVSSLYPQFNIAQKGAESAKENYQQTLVDTSFNVTQTYFGVLKSIKMEKLMSDSLEMARSHLNQVQSKFNAGVVTKADLLKSKIREANAIVSLTR